MVKTAGRFRDVFEGMMQHNQIEKSFDLRHVGFPQILHLSSKQAKVIKSSLSSKIIGLLLAGWERESQQWRQKTFLNEPARILSRGDVLRLEIRGDLMSPLVSIIILNYNGARLAAGAWVRWPE